MGWTGVSLACPPSNHRCAPTLLSSPSFSSSSSSSSSNGVTPGSFKSPFLRDHSCSRLKTTPLLAPPCASRSVSQPHRPHHSLHRHYGRFHVLPVLSTPAALSCLPPTAFTRASPLHSRGRCGVRSGSVRSAARKSSSVSSGSRFETRRTRCNATRGAPANAESEEDDAGEAAAAAGATATGESAQRGKTARGLTAVVLAAALVLAPPLPTPVLHWRLDDSQLSQLSQVSQVVQPLGQEQEVEWEAQAQQWRQAGLGMGVEVRWDDGAAHAFLLEKIKTLERSLESLVTSIKNGKALDKFITVWTGPLVTSDVVDEGVKAVLDAEKREAGFNVERIGEYVADAAADVASKLSRFTLAAEGEVPVAAATGIVEGTFDKFLAFELSTLFSHLQRLAIFAPIVAAGMWWQMQGRNLFPWGGGESSPDGSSRAGGGGGGWESEEEEEARQQRALRVRRELRRIELKAELRDELAALGERALRPGMPPSSTTAAERKEVEDLLLQLCQLGPPIGFLAGGAAEGGDWEGGGVQEWGESEGWDGDGGGGERGAPLTHGSWVLIYASCDPEPPPSADPPPLPAIPLSPMQLLLRAAELPGPLEVWGNTVPSDDLPLLTLTLPVPPAIQRAVAARAATAVGGEWVTCYVDDDLRVDCNEEGLFLAFARAE
ncbi:unnamed protein product [Closterium sp. Yama58-4]|nr:unnamed protein product [Closterium sp. Yama58-4]